MVQKLVLRLKVKKHCSKVSAWGQKWSNIVQKLSKIVQKLSNIVKQLVH